MKGVIMVTIQLRAHLAFLMLPLFVFGVPTDEPDPKEVTTTPSSCRRCCDPLNSHESPEAAPDLASRHSLPYPMPEVRPYINITILKGEKGDRGESGMPGKWGKEGPRVGRKKALHSSEGYQALIFDTVFVNLYGHFNMFNGKFYCYVAGLYFFSLNVHTWNFKETYMHIMRNESEEVILYAQPSDRSIMQSQSLMLELQEKDEVWVRLYKRERENAIYSDDIDVYITFNGYLVKPSID
ncbi:complement C1q tumor necrosis factor-related protein 6 isoform B [Alligator mississippiensis]|uniref:Complement C1q tumor necrosis factor-related protein 6 isoform B n=1 Tax=Alligator mississippiensis TaxID=8496 RepID=A0A151NHS9_ALLMI|nr:complement C1q tumor necrosis factor-related protein 6 isoform B [Alligator mississippiensis]